MSETWPSPELLRFIAKHIRSVEQLEILCLLADDASRQWSVADVLRKIQSSEKSIARCLKKFSQAAFLTEENGKFRFAPQTAALGEQAIRLIKAYRERRVTIVELIYRGPEDPIQHFADAFRLRKDK